MCVVFQILTCIENSLVSLFSTVDSADNNQCSQHDDAHDDDDDDDDGDGDHDDDHDDWTAVARLKLILLYMLVAQ